MELSEYLTRIDTDDAWTASQQIADQLRAAITTGKLKAGERLPSAVRLADYFHVNITTVERSLSSLTKESLTVPQLQGGVLISRQESGRPNAEDERVEREYRASLSQTPAVHDMWALEDRIRSDLHKIVREIENLALLDLVLILENFDDVVNLLAHTVDVARKRVGDYRNTRDRQSDTLEVEEIEINFEYAKNSLETAAWLLSRGRADLMRGID